ncbi:hypothetical protein M9Y60_32755 [Pseudomonas aeruginosa]|nr:hypothetical protein [Pseudomonas aeruginosa]MCL8281979.1 hypothetical protein [Pseudomonas aeruginosa]
MTRWSPVFPDQTAWDAKRRATARRYYLGSRAGLTTIAENYVGLPMERVA